MDKYLCERCGKELVFRCAYSRIDHKLICVECDDKEQPKELAKKIADLEAKLAEKDQVIESLQEINQSLGQTCNNDAKEIERLREQLTDKDVEIEGLKKEIRDELVDNNMAMLELQQSKNQTTIAVLKKVKKLFEEKYAYDVEESDFAVIYETDIDEIIDQQIAELKGEK